MLGGKNVRRVPVAEKQLEGTPVLRQIWHDHPGQMRREERA